MLSKNYTNQKGSRLILPSYLVRLATTSRWPPMLEHIFKIHPLVRLQSLTSRYKGLVLPWEERMTDLSYSVLSAIERGDLEIVELFLRAGMPLMPLIEDSYNRIETLLEQAVRCDQVEIAAMLLNYGANPNEGVSGLGATCVALATIYSHHAMVHLLMERGGNIQDSNALWVMAHLGAEAEAGQTVLDIGADINQNFTAGGTALHSAAYANPIKYAAGTEFARWLLHRGIDPTIEDDEGKTALQVAEERGHTQLRDLIHSWIQEHR